LLKTISSHRENANEQSQVGELARRELECSCKLELWGCADCTGDAQLYGSTTAGGVSIGNGSNVADIVNNTGAVFTCDTSSSIVENSGSTSGYFINDGTFVRNGLGGDTTVSVPFFNHGTVNRYHRISHVHGRLLQ
jgi:hypothetical protein